MSKRDEIEHYAWLALALVALTTLVIIITNTIKNN